MGSSTTMYYTLRYVEKLIIQQEQARQCIDQMHSYFKELRVLSGHFDEPQPCRRTRQSSRASEQYTGICSTVSKRPSMYSTMSADDEHSLFSQECPAGSMQDADTTSDFRE